VCPLRGPERSGNLSKDMPDQPFLCCMDVLRQRGLVQAHLLCQFTGVHPPGMIEKSHPVRFPQDLFLSGSEDVKNPVDMGIVIADREDPESPPVLCGIGNERIEILRVFNHIEAIIPEDNRVPEPGTVCLEKQGEIVGKCSLDKTG